MAISAKHVFDDWLDAISSDQGRASAVCQAPAGGSVLIWDVERVTSIERGDLTILSLRMRCQLPDVLNTVHLTTRAPRVGDKVLLCGFTTTQPPIAVAQRMLLEGLTRVSAGEVIDVWPEGRDKTMLPSSAFAVKCAAFGGMSGGPVFDDSGHMIGIVSSSLDGDDVSFVSHIVPMLTMPFETIWPRLGGTTSLLTLGKRHGVSIFRPDAYSYDVVGGKFDLRYTPWS